MARPAIIGPALGVTPAFVVGPGGLIRIPGVQDQRVALAVCLLFERRSERAVRALWDRLEQTGVPSLRSHTTGDTCRTSRMRFYGAGIWLRFRRRW